MFKSIKLKLTLYFTLLIAIILLGTSYLLYQNSYKNQLSSIDGSLYVIINDVVSDMEEEEDIREDIEGLADEVKMEALHVRMIRYDKIEKTQTLVTKSSTTENSVFANFDLEKEYGKDVAIYRTFNSYRTIMREVVSTKNSRQFIEVALKVSFKNSTFATLVTVNTIILLFSIFGSYFLISRTLLPVDNVLKDVNAIEAYEYKKRVSSQNVPCEIKELVDTFNKLLTRHEESFSKISQFSSDASHELKTPLTTIRGELEVGLRRERDSEEYQNILKKSLSKIIKIQELIDGLLLLAKGDKIELKSSFEELYLDEVITECVDALKNMADKRSIDIKVELLPLTVSGHRKLLKVACLNLLKNAILYSPDNTSISLSIEKHGSDFLILLQDQGIGIPKKDIAHIFDRFYRVNRATSQTGDGTGLGLSIVKMILDIHDFGITIESRENQGTVVKVSLQT